LYVQVDFVATYKLRFAANPISFGFHGFAECSKRRQTLDNQSTTRNSSHAKI